MEKTGHLYFGPTPYGEPAAGNVHAVAVLLHHPLHTPDLTEDFLQARIDFGLRIIRHHVSIPSLFPTNPHKKPLAEPLPMPIQYQYRVGVSNPMQHAILSAVLIAGLLASGIPCEWLCQAKATPASEAAQAHCHNDAQPTTPDQGTPCEDDCPGCGVSSTSIPASEFVAGTTDATDHALAPTCWQAGALRQALVSQMPLSLADPLPPTDILAMTTSLRL